MPLDGERVSTADKTRGSVTVIAATTRPVVLTLPSPGKPIRFEFNPDGRHALLAFARAEDVAIIGGS